MAESLEATIDALIEPINSGDATQKQIMDAKHCLFLLDLFQAKSDKYAEVNTNREIIKVMLPQDLGIPNLLLCAISNHFMVDPVRCAGTSTAFERRNLKAWITCGFRRCPVLNEPFRVIDGVLQVRRVSDLADDIEKWVNKRLTDGGRDRVKSSKKLIKKTWFYDVSSTEAVKIKQFGSGVDVAKRIKSLGTAAMIQASSNPSSSAPSQGSKEASVDHSLSESDPEVYAIMKEGKLPQFKNLELIASENYTSRDHSLSESDPEVYAIMNEGKLRQFKNLELIASENYTSRDVMEAVGSCLTNKYSEGLSGRRYCGDSNEYIDKLETCCQERALSAFHLDKESWGVNVQPLSGSTANFAVYTALLSPHDRIMGLDPLHGGHLSHGCKRRISGTSVYFESMPYRLNESTGLIDYEMLEKTVIIIEPKLIIVGASAYPRDFDYPRMRKIADSVDAFLMMDMAHISGLVAASLVDLNPFEYCDVVTTTTHKSLRGPRGGMIFFKKEIVLGVDLESAINNAVSPGLQGGRHNHTIGGLAVCLKHAQTAEFKAYQCQVKSNCKALANYLKALKYQLVSGGSDNHLVLVDLRHLDIDGAQVEKILDMASITLNKYSLPGDKSVVPRGICIGTPAMTTRGFTEMEFIATAGFIHEGIQVALDAKKSFDESMREDFMSFVGSPEFVLKDRVADLRSKVENLTSKFDVPGV